MKFKIKQNIALILTPIISILTILFVLQSIIPSYGKESGQLEETASEIISCNCVAFTLDDIQNYWLNDVQIEIMELFNEKNLPLTIGIIGSEISGVDDDPKISSYIKQRIPNNLLELANHGWKHEDFRDYDQTSQSFLIKKTNERVQQVFGLTPSVFIPPFNEFNNGTIYAMQENNITHYSSQITASSPPSQLPSSHLYYFPRIAHTGHLSDDGSHFEGVSHNLTLSLIHESISRYGFAVVMMHPQDFSKTENGTHVNQINWNQIRELELLLGRIQTEGLHVVPISKINQDNDNIDQIPSWVKQISIWHSEGKISDVEYANGLKFYRENGIINI